MARCTHPQRTVAAWRPPMLRTGLHSCCSWGACPVDAPQLRRSPPTTRAINCPLPGLPAGLQRHSIRLQAPTGRQAALCQRAGGLLSMHRVPCRHRPAHQVGGGGLAANNMDGGVHRLEHRRHARSQATPAHRQEDCIREEQRSNAGGGPRHASDAAWACAEHTASKTAVHLPSKATKSRNNPSTPPCSGPHAAQPCRPASSRPRGSCISSSTPMLPCPPARAASL